MKKTSKVELIKQPHGGAIRPPMKKGETLNPRGRPKNLLNQIKDELDLEFDLKTNKPTIRILLGSLAYLPKAKLDELYSNENLPVAIRMFIREIQKDWALKETTSVKNLISFDMKPDEDAPKSSVDLTTLTQDQLLLTCQHLLPMFEIKTLEEFCDWLEGFIEKKRAGEARIINQS